MHKIILSKKDYYHFLNEDKKAIGKTDQSFTSLFYHILLPDPIYRFEKLLRKAEYYKNCKKGILNKIYFYYLMHRFSRLSLRLGFTIPLNVFGPGLAIVHYGTIVVNSRARIGANCRIHPSTCIGASGGESFAPEIGENVYIGPGAKIYGDIKIGDNIAIAANAAVGTSFFENNILIGGVPAKKIKDIDIARIIKHIGQ